MTTKEDETKRERERTRLLELITKRPKKDDLRGTGVLLSDAIEHYVRSFDLISPFDSNNLKPANYKLTVGDEYAIGGKIFPLENETGKNEIRIPPFEVAIIKTRETINMPNFLIARWNIQVKRAYEGLLWVGGPQVDAGYVGHLFCPIYNLSDNEVILRYGEAIAVIDFVKTTEFHDHKSKQYPHPPERILFEDYAPEHLVSALASKIEKQIPEIKGHVDSVEKEARARIGSIESRVDTFVTLTFVVISILFAVLGFTQIRSIESSFLGSTVWLAAIALWFSMRTYVLARSGFQQLAESKTLPFLRPLDIRVPWKFEVASFVLIALGFLLFQYQASRTTANSLIQAQKQAQIANEEIDAIKPKLDAENSELRQLQAKNDELQKRVLELEAKSKKR